MSFTGFFQMFSERAGLKVKNTLLLLVWMYGENAIAQVKPVTIFQLLEEKSGQLSALQYPLLVKQFYLLNSYNPVWVSNSGNIQQLKKWLEQSAEAGLDAQDYQFNLLQSVNNKPLSFFSHSDSLMADICFTDAAIHFLNDIASGNRQPVLGYNGLNYRADCRSIPDLLYAAIERHNLQQLPGSLEPVYQEYHALKKQLMIFNELFLDTAFSEKPAVTSTKVSNSNKPLLQRLYNLALVTDKDALLADSTISKKVKEAQRLFDLPDNGIINTELIQELNESLAERIAALKDAINTIRWLTCIRQQVPYLLVVNIPSASLFLYKQEQIVIGSKVVVGKLSTPTPMLSSTITQVILYPYWYVPDRIAVRELLPLIKKHPAYLEANNFQLLDRRGRVVDPATIPWSALNSTNFPYKLRQSTGCDNSLGIVKLDFYNPYSVYLHDTPLKSLFGSARRYYSHGCIRVEKAMELARLVLKDNATIIDSLQAKGYPPQKQPLQLAAVEKIPVFVLYNTAWPDAAGTVHLYRNIYNKKRNVETSR